MKSLSSGTPRARLLSQALSFHLDAHTCTAFDEVALIAPFMPLSTGGQHGLIMSRLCYSSHSMPKTGLQGLAAQLMVAGQITTSACLSEGCSQDTHGTALQRTGWSAANIP